MRYNERDQGQSDAENEVHILTSSYLTLSNNSVILCAALEITVNDIYFTNKKILK